MGEWTFALTDLSGNQVGGVVNASERKVHLPSNGLPVASFTVRLDDSLVKEIRSRTGDVLLKVYQGSTLRFIGDFTGFDHTGEESGTSVVCNFQGPLGRLAHRLIGKSPTGFVKDDLDRGEIIRLILSEANTDHDTGIREGTFGTRGLASVGPWIYKPAAEGITELAAGLIPTYIGKDAFQTGADGAYLSGRNDSVGYLWDWAGRSDAGQDFRWDTRNVGLGAVQRSSTSDPVRGRMAILDHPNQGAVATGMDWYMGEPFGPIGVPIVFGVIARYTDFDHFVTAAITFRTNPLVSYLELVKWTGGGAYTGVYSTTTYLIPSNWYSLQLEIDAAGNWKIWHYDRRNGPGPPIIGPSPITGIASAGRTGFYDQVTDSSGAGFRAYDNYFAIDPTSPLKTVDFELVPSEPTVDGSGIKVATLNVPTDFGTTKPHAVFEYGTGAKSIKTYTQAVSAEGRLTRGISLPPDFSAESTDVRVASDADAITARGVWEDVIPSDVTSPWLRQQICEAHVAVRKGLKETVTFKPVTGANAPKFGDDYLVGDFVTARAVSGSDVVFDSPMRVYGVEIVIDDKGTVDENLELRLE
jgi:hypothetical protein